MSHACRSPPCTQTALRLCRMRHWTPLAGRMKLDSLWSAASWWRMLDYQVPLLWPGDHHLYFASTLPLLFLYFDFCLVSAAAWNRYCGGQFLLVQSRWLSNCWQVVRFGRIWLRSLEEWHWCLQYLWAKQRLYLDNLTIFDFIYFLSLVNTPWLGDADQHLKPCCKMHTSNILS